MDMENSQDPLYIGVGSQDRAKGCHMDSCAEYFSRKALECYSLLVINLKKFKKGITSRESERNPYAVLAVC